MFVFVSLKLRLRSNGSSVQKITGDEAVRYLQRVG